MPVCWAWNAVYTVGSVYYRTRTNMTCETALQALDPAVSTLEQAHCVVELPLTICKPTMLL